MREALGSALAVLSGLTVGVGFAVIWVTLDIPSRLLSIFSLNAARFSGWMLLLGAVFSTATMLMGASLRAGPALGMASLLLGGMMTGILSSALAEVAQVLPRLILALTLTHSAKLLLLAMALGKAAGAFVASYFGV